MECKLFSLDVRLLTKNLESDRSQPSGQNSPPQDLSVMGFVTQSLALLNKQPTYFFSRVNLFVEKLILTSRTANFPNFNKPLMRLTREKLAPKSFQYSFLKDVHQ